MSLVAYGSSDSEEDDDVQDCSITFESSKIDVNDKVGRLTDEVLPGYDGTKVRNELVSKSSPGSLLRKAREPVRITVPSLDQFKNEDADLEPKKKPQFKGGSGLFSMLPPPKHTSSSTTQSFTPHILTKHKEKSQPPMKKAPQPPPAVPVNISPDSKPEPIDCTIPDDDSEDTSSKVDFFSLDTPVILPEDTFIETDKTSTLFATLPEPLKTSDKNVNITNQNSPSISASGYEEPKYDEKAHSENNLEDAEVSYHVEPPVVENSASFLNDKEFLKLKGKRKREEINIIDVNADDQMTGKDEWLMQSLTEEREVKPSKRKHGMPTQQQKRKHQITYLAFRAKERELDLKNQWAMNSLTRRETQAKYGF